MKTVQVSSFSLLFCLVNGRVSSWIAPKIWRWGFQCPACNTNLCAKEQERGGSEGVRQWHRKEPELGTATAQEDTGNLQKGCHGAGMPL